MTGTMATKDVRCFILCLQLVYVRDVLTEECVNGKQVVNPSYQSVFV